MRRRQRFFWGWTDGEYVYTGMYLWRGRFLGVVHFDTTRSDDLRAFLDKPNTFTTTEPSTKETE